MIMERLEPYLERYRQLAPRERRMVLAAAAVLLTLVLYVGVWEPLVNTRAARAEAVQRHKALAQDLEMLAVRVQSARATPGGQVTGRDRSLLAVVDQSARGGTLGKSPSRLQPDGDTRVRVWLEDVQFESLVRWLVELQTRFGVGVETADLEARGAGLVNARLTLERPA